MADMSTRETQGDTADAASVAPGALLLDDNLMSATRLRAQLARGGYAVQTARQVPDAAAPNATAPKLVVINLGSRGLNGSELIGVCRERFPGSRVVGFCGHLETEIRRAARAAGIDKILTNEQAFTDLLNSL